MFLSAYVVEFVWQLRAGLWNLTILATVMGALPDLLSQNQGH